MDEPIQVNMPLPKIKVEVMLAPAMRVDHNKWKLHINGEERIVTQQTVVWFCYTPSEAVESFEWDEVWSFKIEHETEALINYRQQ